jgi:uncharacterized repeat protein (TIGR03837 family)
MAWRWDIFCRVIDNFGDIGVCWRLASDLAARGERVRLWVDDASALAWMATPEARARVEVIAWTATPPDLPPGDVVIEAFGCDPPAAFVARMAAMTSPPAWINLEYLSAEAYVERSHLLPSPVGSGPGRGLVKRYFYPGFTPRTGGLLREPELMAAREAFDRDAWLAAQGWARAPAERVVVLFCYPDPPALPALLAALATQSTLLLATPGAATAALHRLSLPANVRGIALPWLPQPAFDRLLWSADLNLVRGEDSFVRAQWAGAPFVWQIYPQHDDAHVAKLQSFLDRFFDAPGTPHGPWRDQVRTLWSAWNGLAPGPAQLPDLAAWRTACRAWRDGLVAQPDLASQLIALVAGTGQDPG